MRAKLENIEHGKNITVRFPKEILEQLKKELETYEYMNLSDLLRTLVREGLEYRRLKRS